MTDLRAGAAQDIGTLDSGLNSMVLASNNEMVLLPVNEPTFGTKRKSQIQVRVWGGCTVPDTGVWSFLDGGLRRCQALVPTVTGKGQEITGLSENCLLPSLLTFCHRGLKPYALVCWRRRTWSRTAARACSTWR